MVNIHEIHQVVTVKELTKDIHPKESKVVDEDEIQNGYIPQIQKGMESDQAHDHQDANIRNLINRDGLHQDLNIYLYMSRLTKIDYDMREIYHSNVLGIFQYCYLHQWQRWRRKTRE